jgi:chemotaxis protein methyltransferase CheR
MNQFNSIVQWAEEQFGLTIHAHQIERVQREIDRYLLENEIDDNHFFSKLKEKYCPYYNDFINIITVQESYFFRDQGLFLFLKNKYLPMLIKEKRSNNDLTLNFWSAAASLGEEIYTLAILLDELLEDIAKWKICLLGTDINHSALSSAKEGVYRENAMRSISPILINKYFDKKDKHFYLKPRIKEMASFIEHNLSETFPPKQITFDLILCRNVLIYFSQNAIKNALTQLEQALNKNGHLFLGPSDLITYQVHNLLSHHEEGVFYLTRKKEKITQKIKTYKMSPPIEKTPISYAERMRIMAQKHDEVLRLLREKNYEKAILTLNSLLTTNKNTRLLLRYKAEACIGLGDNLTALETLKKALQLDAADPKTYYFMGLCHIELKENKEASECLNKALYLNPEFPEVNYTLGLLLLNDKEVDKGLKKLMLALNQAKEMEADKKVISSNETMADFVKTIEQEIDFYKETFK